MYVFMVDNHSYITIGIIYAAAPLKMNVIRSRSYDIKSAKMWHVCVENVIP